MRLVCVACLLVIASVIGLLTDPEPARAQTADVAALADQLKTLQRDARYPEMLPIALAQLVALQNRLPPDHPDVVQALFFLGAVYFNLGRLVEAEPLLVRSLELHDRSGGNAATEQAFDYLQGLGLLYRAQGRLDDAKRMFGRRVQLAETFQSIDLIGPQLALASSLNSMAVIELDRKDFYSARLLMERALNIVEKQVPADHPILATYSGNLGVIYSRMGMLDEAEALLRRSLSISERSLPPGHSTLVVPLNQIADVYARRLRWAEAVEYSQRATLIILENARRDARATADDGVRVRGDNRPFATLINAAWHLADQNPTLRRTLSEKTFVASQWTAQSSAAVALSQTAARFAVGSDALGSIVRERQDLTRQRQELERLLVTVRTSTHRDQRRELATAARYAEISKLYENITDRLRKEFPSYSLLALPDPMGIKDVQELLKDDEALVQFALYGYGYAWAVTKKWARWVRLDATEAQINESVQELRCGLDRDGEWDWHAERKRWIARNPACATLKPGGLNADEPLPFNTSTAYVLHEQLLGRLRELIEGKRLIIVPDGSLTRLPFHVLVSKDPAETGQGYEGAAWLAKTVAISTLPSATSLKSLRTVLTSKPAANPYLGFGNPLLVGSGGADRRAWERQSCDRKGTTRTATVGRNIRGVLPDFYIGELADVGRIRMQSALPETTDEICAVAKLTKTGDEAIYLGARATETNVKSLSVSGELARARIVHFATHGLLAGETESLARSRAEPALILTPPSSASELDDGLLTASEVAKLHMNADLTILSACNTAAGAGLGGETLSGLVRAFFFAGTRALLVTHWYVNSEAAVKLTTRAVAELESNPRVGRDEALRIAMVAMFSSPDGSRGFSSSVHPSIWAPFTVVGEANR